MEFQNRIKKELSEGIVKSILDDAGYRIIPPGIENLLPDLTVMDREQSARHLVKAKWVQGIATTSGTRWPHSTG